MKTIVMVIDSFGIGEMPDAYQFGDRGSNTFLHILQHTNCKLPNFEKLGLTSIDGLPLSYEGERIGSYGRMFERTKAKDTTAGHYEMMDIIQKHPNPVFPNGFDEKLMKKIEKATGQQFIGNEVASGTEIIARLGEEHLRTKKPIIYTSQDSCLQIACHIDVLSLEQLYDLCAKIRKVAKGKYAIGRVIARPFAGNVGEFYRTEDRRDFALNPPKKSVLDKLTAKGVKTIGVGKIKDIFAGHGIQESFHTKNNTTSLQKVVELAHEKFDGFVFANLVDTDMLYGHRNNIEGYAKALEQIDATIPTIMEGLEEDDVLVITADHGCDPSTPSTDHSREYVPILVCGPKIKAGINLHTLYGFNQLGKSILDRHGVKKYKYSLFKKLEK